MLSSHFFINRKSSTLRKKSKSLTHPPKKAKLIQFLSLDWLSHDVRKVHEIGILDTKVSKMAQIEW